MAIRTFFRIVRVNPPTDRDFWSHQRLGKTLRDPTPQSRDQWAGVSVYADMEDAINLSRQFPRLGQWVAEVHLQPAADIRIEKTGSKRDSHHTVWAASEQLLRSVVAVRGIPGGQTR